MTKPGTRPHGRIETDMSHDEVSRQLNDLYDSYAKMALLHERCLAIEMIGTTICCLLGVRFLPIVGLSPLIILPRWIMRRTDGKQLRKIFQAASTHQLSFGQIVECFVNGACLAVGTGAYAKVLRCAIANLDIDTFQDLTPRQMSACNSLLMFWSESDVSWIRTQCSEPLLDKIWFIGNASTIPVLEGYISKQSVPRLRRKAEVALEKLRERLGDTSLLRQVGVAGTPAESGELLRGTYGLPRIPERGQPVVGDACADAAQSATSRHSAP